MERKSNVPMIVVSVVSTFAFAIGTYVVVEAAGGTKIEPGYSNTPNATIPGPPGVK
jgi:hypothetical protein